MTEAQEQRAVVEWCDRARIPVFHIPNGGYRHPAEARNLRLQGVRAGVPDLFVPIARGGYHGLFVEMKRKDGGSTTLRQRIWLARLAEEGYRAAVCHGAEEAIGLIREYADG